MKLNAEQLKAFDEQGFFCTGDLGRMAALDAERWMAIHDPH